MNHLGDRLTALVDGQLGIEAGDRALAHLVDCPECREALETERLTKIRLASLGSPEPGERLVAALRDLAGPSGPLPPRPGHVPGSPRPELLAGLTSIGVGLPEAYRSGEAPWSLRPTAGRPPLRRDSSRPSTRGGERLPAATRLVGRSSRNRMAAAVVGAACLVGAGVAGGIANGQPVTRTVVPPIDSYVLEHNVTAGVLPLGDQTVMWGTVGAGR